MKLFGTTALGAVAALSMAATQAAALDYVCEFKNPSSRKTIPEQVVIKVSEDGKSAQVIDPFLLYYGEAPKQASSFSDNKKIMKVKWYLRADNGGSIANFDYFLVYKKKRGKAWVSLTPRGYDNNESGNGKCEVRS